MLGEDKIIMKASMKLFLIASILLFTFNSICYAKKSLNDMTMWERLVGKKKVFAIATAPGIPKGKTPYFTSKSLEKKLSGVPGAPQVDVTNRQWIYTHGIDLATIRKMLGPMQDR